MNAASARRIASQTIIVACLAGGAWHLGLRPMQAQLAHAQATLQAQRDEVAGHEAIQGTAVADPQTRAGLVQARAARLEELSRRSGDASGLYDLIGALALRSGVQVHRIEPKGSIQTVKDKSAEGTEDAAHAYAVVGVQYGIDLAGDYSHIADFLRLLEQDAGLTKIVSIRLSPGTLTGASDQSEAPVPMLNAAIETCHYRLAAPGADLSHTAQPIKPTPSRGGHR